MSIYLFCRRNCRVSSIAIGLENGHILSRFHRYIIPEQWLKEGVLQWRTGSNVGSEHGARGAKYHYNEHSNALQHYCKKLDNVLFFTCGDWDIGKQIPLQFYRSIVCGNSNKENTHIKEFPSYLMQWMNVKTFALNYYQSKNSLKIGTSIKISFGTMANLLKFLQIPLDGVHHLGMHDTDNIAKICIRLLVDGAVLDITTSREHHVDGNGNVATVLKHSYAQRIGQLHLAKNQKEICIKKQDRREEDEKVEKKETEIDQIETKGSKKAAPLFPLFYTYSDVVSLQNQLKSVTTYNCPLLLRQQQQQQQQNTAFNGKLCLKQYVWDFDQQKLRVNCNTNVLPKVMSENIFWENEHVIVVYDLFPKAKLHLLVLPKTVYIDSIHDLNPKNFAHVQTLLAISDIAQILYQQFVLAFFFFNYYSHFLSSLLFAFLFSFSQFKSKFVSYPKIFKTE
ncbi:hypothetical protein RFI_34578, partial [Reticulomyxa filosa]